VRGGGTINHAKSMEWHQMSGCSIGRWVRLFSVRLIAAMLVLIGTAAEYSFAKDQRRAHAVEFVASRVPGEPVIAIVSLRSQAITVYDANGWIARAPVSSGDKGRETPAGVFSVLQKDADHHSNLYDDAFMPHMQRLTWSGIALHGGALPGYPASHGCVRMPFDFAARLFDMTQLGLRVIVAPGDVAPVEITHPVLSRFSPSPEAAALAAARAAEAEQATRKADEARLAAVAAAREAARAAVPVRVAENLLARTREQLAIAEAALDSADEPSRQQAEQAKASATGRIADLTAQLAAARADLEPKLGAVKPAREAAVAAEAARIAATAAAKEAALEPVSVFVSRKTQRLYVRRGVQPVLESEIAISETDRPIGTHVFTALSQDEDKNKLRWIAVSLDEKAVDGQAQARAALDRIAIPPAALERIVSLVSPRSSLIISDEEISPETANDTDFIVVLGGEPQGSLKMRRRGRVTDAR
jgi:L,D-transpeptidase-like protein